MKVWRSVWEHLGLFGAASLLVGCPGGGRLENDCFPPDCGSGGGGPVTTCDPTGIFQETCGSLVCHGGGIPPLLTSPTDPMALGLGLLDVPATYTSQDPACPRSDPELVIDSAEPARSLILTKVLGSGFACGEVMPPGVPLPPDDRACIEQWVSAVAVAGSPVPGQ